jgi:hypothetical protein
MEVMMQPLKHAATIAMLNLTPGLANGHGTLPQGPQAPLLFLQKDGSTHPVPVDQACYSRSTVTVPTH